MSYNKPEKEFGEAPVRAPLPHQRQKSFPPDR